MKFMVLRFVQEKRDEKCWFGVSPGEKDSPLFFKTSNKLMLKWVQIVFRLQQLNCERISRGERSDALQDDRSIDKNRLISLEPQ